MKEYSDYHIKQPAAVEETIELVGQWSTLFALRQVVSHTTNCHVASTTNCSFFSVDFITQITTAL
jgi:hypothetical protein